MVVSHNPRRGRHAARRFNGLKPGKRFAQVGTWPEDGVHNHGEPKPDRTYEDVVDYFHNYEHSPEGLNHCQGSEANPYRIVHVGTQHKINLSYARGHGEGNVEQWFRFTDYLEDGYSLETGVRIPEPPRDKWNVRETRYLSTRKARRIQGSVMREMARRPAGQRQRIGSGDWEQKTNRQQRKIVATFDSWVAALKRDISARAKRGATLPELSVFLDEQIPKLEARLVEVMTKGVEGAVKTVAGKRADLPQIRARAERMVAENVALVRENLVPHIHEKLTLALAAAVPGLIIGGLAVEQQRAVAMAIRNASAATRAAPAQYAGGYWVAIFETQRTLGEVKEDERAAQGLDPEPVKWNLDPRAVHCKPSPGFFGCPEMAKQYASFRDLLTVPAGQVTCRGNCRCFLTVFRNGQWQRGIYDD